MPIAKRHGKEPVPPEFDTAGSYPLNRYHCLAVDHKPNSEFEPLA